MSTLIGQLGIVHICDWLTKVEQIYEPSSLLFHESWSIHQESSDFSPLFLTSLVITRTTGQLETPGEHVLETLENYFYFLMNE